MSTKILTFTSYHAALRSIIAEINKRKVDLDVRHLLIVPERYTLLAEKYLYERSQGSFDIEVLSLSRLFYKMQIKTPLLSREGAIMLLRGMLPSIELKCYYRSASFRGFCEKLYDAINDFAASGIGPEDIPDASYKLRDLKTIYFEYKKRIEGRFVDSMGKLDLIAREAATSEYLDNVHIYVANFDYVDKATRDVFDVLEKRALSFTECAVCDDEEIRGRREKFFGDGAVAVKEVAKRIRYLAYKGVPYEDMAVIMGNASAARVRRIFKEFELPCFISENKRLYELPLASYVLSLIECARRKNRESFIILSKNLYMGIEKHTADEFENYVNSHLIDYKEFYEAFADCPIEVERARQKLVNIVSVAERGMKNTDDARSFGEFLESIIDADVEAITEKAFDSIAAVEKMKALVSLMEQVGIKGTFDFISAVFVEGLKATEMSSIPYQGGVIVGDPAAFRGGKYKFVAVLGFDDGFLPQIYDDGSLISDDEKETFSQMERAAAINHRYERELCAVLASADNIFATYSSPSGMMNEIFADDLCVDVYENDPIFSAGSKVYATERMLELIRLSEITPSDERRTINALFVATGSGESLLMSHRTEMIENAEKLFFPVSTTSVSKLQSFFACPYKHFIDYGLRLKERDKGEISAIDTGNFFHLVVEKIVASGDYSDINVAVNKAVDEIANEGKFSLSGNKSSIERLKEEAVEIIEIYTRHLQKSKFKPIGEELVVSLDLDGTTLTGKIDMADEYNGYIRLIDYKTGEYKLKYSDVYYGEKIQLPLYMAACSEKYKPAAMFNFPFSYNWTDDKNSHRFSGFLLDDDDVINAVAGEFEDESEVFDLKREAGKIDGGDYLVDEETMKALSDYAVRISKEALKDIKSGYAAASPCGTAPCDYCEYKCICANRKVRATATIRKSVFSEKKDG